MPECHNNSCDPLEVAKRVFAIEASAVSNLSRNLDDSFGLVVQEILGTSGRTIICGMGKSGIIGKKIAATLASTGTPSFFMHPGEAFHGDLGMVTPADIFIAISYSGETDEVVKLLPFLRDNRNVVVAITGAPTSTIARTASFHLNVNVEREACPLLLAPTSSTTATLAMGDALAVSLMEARGFKPENFARFHPGGSLGRRLLSKVENEMVTAGLPIIDENSSFMSILGKITSYRLGFVIVSSADGDAIITDGDIRRAVERNGRDVFDLVASNLMTRCPASVPIGTRVEDALALMERRQISCVFVYDSSNTLSGVFRK